MDALLSIASCIMIPLQLRGSRILELDVYDGFFTLPLHAVPAYSPAVCSDRQVQKALNKIDRQIFP
jgi:hypothetical protein